MKTLRYLLIVALISLTSVLSATNVAAQNLAQRPEAQMQSTSIIQGSGSTLPQAAQTGTYMTGNTPGSYSPARISSGPRRGASAEDGGDTPPEDPHGPNEDPLGDAAWPLMIAAAVYCVWCIVYRRRKRA